VPSTSSHKKRNGNDAWYDEQKLYREGVVARGNLRFHSTPSVSSRQGVRMSGGFSADEEEKFKSLVGASMATNQVGKRMGVYKQRSD
jgi:hypothetical protein